MAIKVVLSPWSLFSFPWEQSGPGPPPLRYQSRFYIFSVYLYRVFKQKMRLATSYGNRESLSAHFERRQLAGLPRHAEGGASLTNFELAGQRQDTMFAGLTLTLSTLTTANSMTGQSRHIFRLKFEDTRVHIMFEGAHHRLSSVRTVQLWVSRDQFYWAYYHGFSLWSSVFQAHVL